MIADLIPKIAGMKAEEEWSGEYVPRASISGEQRCIRAMVYWSLGFAKKPWSGRMILTVDDSAWHEELTLDWIRQSAFRVHSEQMHINIPAGLQFLSDRTCGCGKNIPEGNIAGHIDCLITDILETDRVLEHKAINHFTFQKYWKNEELPLDYLCQISMYLWGLSKINPSIEEGILLIKNKNTAAYMEYRVRYKYDTLYVIEKTNSNGDVIVIDKLLDDIITKSCIKFIEVNNYCNTKILPKRPYTIDSWRCDYCSWGKKCWEGYEDEFKTLKTSVNFPEEVSDTVRFYRELGAQIKDMGNQRDEVGKTLKGILKQAEAREGRAGEYLCKLTLAKTETIDKSLLSEEEIRRVSKVVMYEKLNISKIKEESHEGKTTENIH